MKQIIGFDGSLINALERADVDKLLSISKEECMVIPDEIDGMKVDGIASDSFYGISGIKEIVFPKGLVLIQPYSIINCDVEKLIFGKNVKRIEFEDFRTNKNLDCIEVDDRNSFYATNQGNLYSADKVRLIYGLNNQIAPGTIKIGESAFAKSNIESIYIPLSVEIIGTDAFFKCEQLKQIKFSGNQLVWIGAGAFGQCSSLKQVVIPRSVDVIEYAAFGDSGLEELRFEERDVSSRILRIYAKAFMNTKLKIVDFSSAPDVVIENEVFMNSEVKSLSLAGMINLENHAFGNANIEKLSLKFIDADIPKLKKISEPFGINSSALIELISKHNRKKDEITYILHENTWIEDRFW